MPLQNLKRTTLTKSGFDGPLLQKGLGIFVTSTFKNIITFGAAGRVDSEQEDLDRQISEFRELENRVDQHKTSMQGQIERLVKTKVSAIGSLGRLRELSRNLSVRERDLAERDFSQGDELALKGLDVAVTTLSAGETAINAAKSLGAGASTALGAWALVGAYGTASTGTAIATLSGAAATNATLAALGGGSLAAGGGGIAAGGAVLGGLITIPALLGLAAFNHHSANKKIAAMREYSLQVVHATESNQKALLIIDLAAHRASELAEATIRAESAFLHQFEAVRKKLFPRGVFSKLWRHLRQLFGGRFFNTAEVSEIAYIGNVASQLARIVDVKVFESDGSVTQGLPA